MSETPRRYSVEVNRAAGIVTTQAECRVEQALALMYDRAQVWGLTIDEVAQGVLEHTIRFGHKPRSILYIAESGF